MRSSILALLFLATCNGCASPGTYHENRVNLSAYEPVLDRLFSQLGPMEFALCLDGVELPDGYWTVTGVSVPLQLNNDSTSVGPFFCETPGFAHNHPVLGGMFGNRPVCSWNPTDSATLARFARFSVTWCEPGKFFSYSRVK